MKSLFAPLPLARLTLAALLALLPAFPIQAGSTRSNASGPAFGSLEGKVRQAAGGSNAVRLVTGGTSEHAIFTDDNPSVTEKLAAGQLAHYLERLSRAKLPIKKDTDDGQAGPKAIKLMVRPGSGTHNRLNRIIPSDDAYAIDVSGDGTVVLEGATGRALLYAVYRFLEQLGCRCRGFQLMPSRGIGSPMS